MRSFCLVLGLFFSYAWASPFRVMVDRSGEWECEWQAGDYRFDTAADGSVGVVLSELGRSDVPGDLSAPRLHALLALPKDVVWKAEVVQDSSELVQGVHWRRVPGYDTKTNRPVPVPAVDREGWSQDQVDGFRLVRMDFPLVVPAQGGVRLRRKVRLRVSWEGAARVPRGSPWAALVANPNGIRLTNPVAARAFATTAAKMEGQMVQVDAISPDPYSTSADGVVRLRGDSLIKAAGVAPGVSFRNIAVYAGVSDTLPSEMPDSIVAPSLKPIAIQHLDRNGDGLLDATDEIRFWVRGPNLWRAAAGDGIGWRYTINPYTLRRRYLVRLDASTPSPLLETGATGASPTSFATVPHPYWVGKPSSLLEKEVGKDTVTEMDLGKSWYWKSREGVGSFDCDLGRISMPGKATDSVVVQPVVVRNTWFKGGISAVASIGYKNGSSWSAAAAPGTWAAPGPTATGAEVRITSTANNMAVAGFQILYRRDPTLTDSGLIATPAVGSVSIAVPNGKECWVIEDGAATRLCTIRDGRLLDSAKTPNTWYAYFPKDPKSVPVALSAWTAPSQKHAVKDFNASLTTPVLVIAPTFLADLAEEYALHREDKSFQIRPMNVAIVRTEDIYALWGAGQTDPVAIRDCIRWAHDRWGVSHVLLLGGGHSDPRKLLGPASDVAVPQWEDHSVSTDDFFTYLGAGDPIATSDLHVPAVALGRVPAYTVAEARAWLDKLQIFEVPAKAEFGPWRNTVVIAADDMMQQKDPDGIEHTNQSELIADAMLRQRPWLRQEKLYMVKYPPNALDLKPEAARDFQALLNRGVVGVNYMGHGGMNILADESLLDIPAVDRTLVNKTRPFLFFAGSCTVGRNDVSDQKGLSEYLLVAAGKGAVAAISGTRTTFVGGNLTLSKEFWRAVADTNKTLTVGEALLAAKESFGPTGSNDVTPSGTYRNHDFYNLLGDPAMILIPGGIPVSLSGLPDTIAAISRIQLLGRAPKAAQIQARLDLKPINDSAPVVLRGQVTQRFHPTLKSMAVQQASVVSDSVKTTLAIPARVPFGDSATLRAYAWDPASRKDGGQILAPRLIRGTALSGGIESTGPSITLRPCDSSWSGGVPFVATAQIQLPFCLSVDLFDSSGISSESGPDEGVVFSVPGIREPWHPDLSQVVDFRHASAQLVIDSTLMPAGKTYPFEVLARDLMGNLSRSRLQVQVLAYTDYSLYEVFNSPNPVREGENTAFYFKVASEPDTNGTIDSRVQASIRIHTVSGKLVKVLRTELSKATQPRPKAVWDLRDAFGTPVANGIYPYTVVLRIPNETGTNSTELVRKGVVAISR